jgi:hypothetical protein
MIAQFQMVEVEEEVEVVVEEEVVEEEVVEEEEKIQDVMLLNKDVFACGLMFLLGLTEFYQLMEIT